MIKRNRPRPNGGVRPNNRPHQNGHQNGYSNSKNDDNNELRLKNRGYYQQMYDKYLMAARESLSLGERIEAEGHFQHAEHYLRQLNDRVRYDNEVQQQQQQRLQAQQAQKAQQHAQQNQSTEVEQNSDQSELKDAVQNEQRAQNDARAPRAQGHRPQQEQRVHKEPRAQHQPRRAHVPADTQVEHEASAVLDVHVSTVTGSDVSVDSVNAQPVEVHSDEPQKEKRVYRKRVLRTPHRRFNGADGAETSATDVPSA